MKSGGSPSGDSAPPTLPTSRMKNTTACTRWRRVSLAVRSGRISSMAAPVVPMMLARHAPRARSPVLTAGVPASVPRRQMPPAMVKSANSMARNGTYSSKIAWATLCSISPAPNVAPNGTAAGASRRPRICRNGRARAWVRAAGRRRWKAAGRRTAIPTAATARPRRRPRARATGRRRASVTGEGKGRPGSAVAVDAHAGGKG